MNFSHAEDGNHSHDTVTRTTYYAGKLISVHVDEGVVEGQSRRFELVTHSGAVVIVARPQPEKLILVNQWRQGAGQRLWEVPAGCLDADEQNDACALRELREETGFHAQRLTYLWSAYPAPAYCNEILHFYVADNLIPGEREPDEGEEQMIVQAFHVSEIEAMVSNGKILDLKSLLAIRWFIEQTQKNSGR